MVLSNSTISLTTVTCTSKLSFDSKTAVTLHSQEALPTDLSLGTAYSVTVDKTDTAPSVFGFSSATTVACTLTSSSMTVADAITSQFSIESASYSIAYGEKKLAWSCKTA